MNGVAITRARAADAAPLARILGDWVRATGWMPSLHTAEEDLAFLGHLIETTEVWTARTDAPLGFVARDGAEVRALYIAAPARGHGIGTRLLDQARTGRDRLTLWTFQANTGAILFYTRHGFAESGRTDGADNDEGLPDLHFTWTRKATA